MGQNPLLTHFGPISGHSLLGGWKLFSKKGPEEALTQHKPRRSTKPSIHKLVLKKGHQKGISPEFVQPGFREKKTGAISGNFLLIFLCLGQIRPERKPALNPGTHVNLVKVLPQGLLQITTFKH